MPGPCKRSGTRYMMFGSGATPDGSHGVELWVKHESPQVRVLEPGPLSFRPFALGACTFGESPVHSHCWACSSRRPFE